MIADVFATATAEMDNAEAQVGTRGVVERPIDMLERLLVLGEELLDESHLLLDKVGVLAQCVVSEAVRAGRLHIDIDRLVADVQALSMACHLQIEREVIPPEKVHWLDIVVVKQLTAVEHSVIA